MNWINFALLIFLLTAFSLGAGLQDVDFEKIDSSFNTASEVINKVNFNSSYNDIESMPNGKGLFVILEKYVHFVSITAIEIMRTGVYFGRDYPDYFQPEFVIKVIRLLVILAIISLLIKPVGYILIFIILGIMALRDRLKKRRKNRIDKSSSMKQEVRE